MKRSNVIADVLDAARGFCSRKLWKRFTSYDCFGVRIAGQEELMLGVVLGDAGGEYGLSLFRGPHAAATLGALLGPGGPGDDTLEEMDTLGFSMEAFGDLPLDVQALFREAGQHPRYSEHVPSFLAKLAGQQARLPNEVELALLGQVLWAMVVADNNKMLRPATLDDKKGICVMQMLLVVDDTNELILQGKPVFSGNLKGAADTLSDTFQGKGLKRVKGLPREIIFSSLKLHDAMAPTLEPLGVTCTYTPTIPKLQEIVGEFYDVVDSDLAPSSQYLEELPGQDMETPAPDDLKGWNEAAR